LYVHIAVCYKFYRPRWGLVRPTSLVRGSGTGGRPHAGPPARGAGGALRIRGRDRGNQRRWMATAFDVTGWHTHSRTYLRGGDDAAGRLRERGAWPAATPRVRAPARQPFARLGQRWRGIGPPADPPCTTSNGNKHCGRSSPEVPKQHKRPSAGQLNRAPQMKSRVC
jgi:hypothetical protein